MASSETPKLNLRATSSTRKLPEKRPINRMTGFQFCTQLSTFNSADLSNLFADVNRLRNGSSREELPVVPAHSDPKSYRPLSKKRRIAVSNSVSQDSISASPQNERNTAVTRGSTSSECDRQVVKDDLPSIVSRSFSTDNIPDSMLQQASHDDSDDCGFGWYVDMDSDDDVDNRTITDPYKSASSITPLAFSAQTAPKAVDQVAEVEWAKAADMVDEVLGDFF